MIHNLNLTCNIINGSWGLQYEIKNNKKIFFSKKFYFCVEENYQKKKKILLYDNIFFT
jgi:hypothetical protein